MKLKTPEIIIDEKDPFANCKLDRKKYGIGLTRIVENYSDGFVLAINNEWGTGKTTFLQMWQQMLINEGFRTVYFNAWECDYETNPLAAILSELRHQTKSKNASKFNKLIKTGAAITTSLLPAIVNAAAKRYVDQDVLRDGIQNISKDSIEIFKKEIDDYIQRKNSLTSFRLDLANFLQNESEGKALIFIIDELDRCRPDFAVSILEQIKHLFSVDGVIFILSIDKTQLINAINGYYGSQNFDSETYLKRFIDLEFHLPRPDIRRSVELFLNRFDFRPFYQDVVRHDMGTTLADYQSLIKFATNFSSKYVINLRSLEKLLSHLRIALTQFKDSDFVIPEMLFVLVYLRNFDFEFYCSIQNREVTFDDLNTKIENLLTPFRDNENLNFMTAIFTYVMVFYRNDLAEKGNRRIDLVYRNVHSPTFPTTLNQGFVVDSIINIENGPVGKETLKNSMDKIDFTAQIFE